MGKGKTEHAFFEFGKSGDGVPHFRILLIFLYVYIYTYIYIMYLGLTICPWLSIQCTLHWEGDLSHSQHSSLPVVVHG